MLALGVCYIFDEELLQHDERAEFMLLASSRNGIFSKVFAVGSQNYDDQEVDWI